MSAATFSKWDRIRRGRAVMVGPQDLSKIRLSDFEQIAADSGLKVIIERMKPGWYRLQAQS